ncbi:hypothetical protein PGT21_022455 [Puccinia graminis f. sp. tritici]|uniref:Uncharacterized protein n=1 Tax=Puccinia graminis f. sp. tritici TaxID=56615 RepID=A0A5B0PJX4_PUCGR|nr:hypothetical protein PGT21_022455 [Puccinia graminis f. sp. tritici]
MDNPTSTAHQRTSDLLTIPNQIPADWPAAFQSARIKYIIPADQTAILPESDDQHPTDQSELLSWLDKLIKTPTRQSVYLGESLKVHIILSLTEPANVGFTEHDLIQNHLQANLSIHIQGNVLQAGSPTTIPSIRAERYHVDSPGPSPRQNRSKQPNLLGRPQPSIRIPHSDASSQYESHQLSKPFQLFTGSYSHAKAEPPNESERLDSSHPHKLKPSNTGTRVTLQVAKLANQWLVVWKVSCELGHLQESNQTGSLSLSAVITYHSTQSPVFDLPGPSILPIPLLSDSPPNFNPHPSSSRIGDAGFENAIEIDLFDGMGRDISVSLTRPLIAPGSSASAYQSESTHKSGQSNRLGSPSNRFSHPHPNLKISSGMANPSRSEDYLPSYPEERRQSAPAISIPIARRAFSSAYHKEPAPITPSYQEIEPNVSDLPYLERHLMSMIPIVDPLILRVDTIAPQRRLKPRGLAAQLSNHPEIGFIEMEKPFNPMLMLELSFPEDSMGTIDDEFLLERLDIKIEKQGLFPEFDHSATSTITIIPIHPTQPPDGNLPYRISRNEIHSLIYGVQIEPADLLPEQGQRHASSCLQYDNLPINVSLPPSTLISSVNSAFNHQKTGIPIVQEGYQLAEDDNLSSCTAVGRAENYVAGGGSTTLGPGKAYKSTRASPLRHSHDPGVDDTSGSEVGLQLKNSVGVVYLLSITIRGKMVSKHSRIESTGPIGSTWTCLLSSLDLSDSATLDLCRQTTEESLGIPLVPYRGDEQAEKFAWRSPVHDLILPGRCDDGHHYKRSVLPHGGLVAGSKRHTASNLMNALQELSTFQRTSSTRGLPLPSERSRMRQKQLSPLAIHGSTFVHQNAYAEDLSFADPPPSSVPNTGRRFLPEKDNKRRTLTPTASHPSPRVPERVHQPAEGDPGAYTGGYKANKTNRPPGQTSSLSTPVLIESSFGHAIPTGAIGGPFDGLRGERGAIMIKVNCSSPTGGDGSNRFKVLQEFAVEILVFNRSSSATTEGPFKVKILTNSNLLKSSNHTQLPSPNEPSRTHLFAPPQHLHPADHDHVDDIGGGVVSLDEAIQIGPLGGGECQAVKIRLIGLKPGIFQLYGIHFVSIHSNPPPPHHQEPIQPISEFVLVDPLVVLIE